MDKESLWFRVLSARYRVEGGILKEGTVLSGGASLMLCIMA